MRTSNFPTGISSGRLSRRTLEATKGGNDLLVPGPRVTDAVRSHLRSGQMNLLQVDQAAPAYQDRLRIKTVFGTSDHAVRTQLWIAISVYLLVAHRPKAPRNREGPLNILQIVSVVRLRKPLSHKGFRA